MEDRTTSDDLRTAVRAALGLGATTRLLAFGAERMLDAGEPTAHLALVAPSHVGPMPWPAEGPSVSVAADPLRLPFVEAMFDVALVIDSLEHGPAPDQALRELWRVLAPAGVLVVVVPRRRRLGLLDAHPLPGRHWSRKGLTALLDAAMFEPVEWTKTGGVFLVRATKSDGLAPVARAGRIALVLPEPA